MTMQMSARTKYKIEETEWLLGGRVHPLNIASALEVTPKSLYEMARTHKVSTIQEAFKPYAGATS